MVRVEFQHLQILHRTQSSKFLGTKILLLSELQGVKFLEILQTLLKLKKNFFNFHINGRTIFEKNEKKYEY